jgi:serine protease Do
MVLPGALLLLLTANDAEVPLAEWVHERIDAQRGTVDRPAAIPSSTGRKALWREPNGTANLPGFVPPTSFAALVRAVRASVVNISTTNEGTSHSLGSGFLVSPDGLVVTNNHVVERAQRISARLFDGRELEAAVLGRDPSTDLALLKLEGAKGLPTVALGDSDQLEVGDWVVAIGNPFGLHASVTHGIISARERVIGVGPFDDFLQTNADINPGNSGGPLFDMHGAVVGVTTAVSSQGQGIGFAVPINLVKELLPNLLEDGRFERGWLGVNVQEVVEGPHRSSVVMEVFKGSPAEKAGLQLGDRIVTVGGRTVERYQQLLRKLAFLSPGEQARLGVIRGGKAREVTVTMAARPSAEAMQALASGGRVDALGLVVAPVDAAVARQLGLASALKVQAVMPGGPAERAGVMSGDLLLEVNRQPVLSLKDLDAALAVAEPQEPHLLKVKRGEAARYLAVRPR